MNLLLNNAICSIQMGIEDFETGKPERMISAVRNLQAGILLLCKEKLLRLSPPDSDGIFIKDRIVPRFSKGGVITFTSEGKNTVTVYQIKVRFKDLGVHIDEDRLDRITNIRNNLEHYYSDESPASISEAISNTFIIIRDFIQRELSENPIQLLGEPTWRKMLKQNEVFEREFKECQSSLLNWGWPYDTFLGHIEENRIDCRHCDSSLIFPVQDNEEDLWDGCTFQCRQCGAYLSVADVCYAIVCNYLSYNRYLAAKYGGEFDYPFDDCPNCELPCYVLQENKCIICEYELSAMECKLCGEKLALWERSFNGYCSRHQDFDDE